MTLKLDIIKEDLCILLEDVSIKSNQYTIYIKKGFDFDGASIPRIFWSIIGNPISGKFNIAALVHDALYASQFIDRKICDEIFLNLMKVYNVSYLKRYSMFNAVRLFGFISWNKNKEDLSKYRQIIYMKNEADLFLL